MKKTEESPKQSVKSWCRIDQNQAEKLTAHFPVEEEIQDLADFFRVLGDPTRIRILSLLASQELCVHDLALLLNMQQSAVSHQLKVLRQNRLIKYRKEGQMAVYSPDDTHVDQITSLGFAHVRERNA